MKQSELKVFLVDDDQIFRFLCKKMLQKFVDKSQIYEFVNGKDALDNIAINPDIILLDINMPVLDGWQFLEELTKKTPNPDIKICIISSSIDPSDKEKFDSYPFLESFINKPLQIESLEVLFK